MKAIFEKLAGLDKEFDVRIMKDCEKCKAIANYEEGE